MTMRIRTVSTETPWKAKRYKTAEAAEAAALDYMDARSPHLFGRVARVYVNRAAWPSQTFLVGLVSVDTGVRVAYVSELEPLARPPVGARV